MSAPARSAFTEITKAYRSTCVTSMISNNVTRVTTRSLSSNNVTTVATRSMSAFSHMSDNDPGVLEREKHKELNKREKKEWNEKLASHSEAAVSIQHRKCLMNIELIVLND